MILITRGLRHPTVRIYAYLIVLWASIVVLATLLDPTSEEFANPWVLGGLAVVACIAERGRVQLGSNLQVSIAFIPMVFAAALFGPFAAMIVGGASMLGQIRQPLPWSIFTGIRTLTAGLAGVAAVSASDLVESHIGAVAVAAAVGAFVAETVDVALGGVTYWLRGHGRIGAVIRTLAPLIAISVVLYAPLVALLALAYLDLSPWMLPLFFGPALAAQRLFVLYQTQRQLTDEVVAANVRLERANLSFTAALVTTLDARDRYTAGHSAAVAVYARDVAARMGLSDVEQDLAHQCGLVHDLGKIGLPAGLLEKPGALTLDERRQMEKHPEIGERILAKVDDYGEIARIVRHHHERIDGNGYPDGLTGDDIPLLSRIIAVADAYNAMTSDRPYRDAMPSRVARLRLAQAVENQFDTAVVAAFEAILAGASDDYRCARTPEFEFAVQERVIQADALISAVA